MGTGLTGITKTVGLILYRHPFSVAMPVTESQVLHATCYKNYNEHSLLFSNLEIREVSVMQIRILRKNIATKFVLPNAVLKL